MDNQAFLAPIIATRPMTWTRADGVVIAALVEIGLPFEHPNPPGNREGDWCCQVKATGLGDDRIYTMFGGDSIEALASALTFGGVIVSHSPVAASLDWAQFPNHGFPVEPGVGGGPAGPG